MSRKAPKCSKGFPCGKVCIKRTYNCWANLSTNDNRIAETFSQFVNRLVGIGNNTQSELNNQIKAQERTTEILKKVSNNIESGSKVKEILEKLNPELSAGKNAIELLNKLPIEEVIKQVEIEVLPNDITKIPKLLNPDGGKIIDIEARVLEEIEAGEKVNKILSGLKPNITSGNKVEEILKDLKPQIDREENLLDELKQKPGSLFNFDEKLYNSTEFQEKLNIYQEKLKELGESNLTGIARIEAFNKLHEESIIILRNIAYDKELFDKQYSEYNNIKEKEKELSSTHTKLRNEILSNSRFKDTYDLDPILDDKPVYTFNPDNTYSPLDLGEKKPEEFFLELAQEAIDKNISESEIQSFLKSKKISSIWHNNNLKYYISVLESKDNIEKHKQLREINNQLLELKDKKENIKNDFILNYNGINPEAHKSKLEPKFKRESISDNIAKRKLPKPKGTKLEEKVQALIDASEPMMAINQDVFERLINGDGDFKNVYDQGSLGSIAEGPEGTDPSEVDKSYVQAYIKERRNLEKKMFEIGINASPDKRPVYGFMERPENVPRMMNMYKNGGISAYGNIVIVFNNELKDDITVTLGDSYAEFENDPDAKASPANAFSEQSAPDYIRNNPDNFNYNATTADTTNYDIRYIEWQSGGRLNIKQVGRAYIPMGLYTESQLKAIEEKGIKVVLVYPQDKLPQVESPFVK